MLDVSKTTNTLMFVKVFGIDVVLMDNVKEENGVPILSL